LVSSFDLPAPQVRGSHTRLLASVGRWLNRLLWRSVGGLAWRCLALGLGLWLASWLVSGAQFLLEVNAEAASDHRALHTGSLRPAAAPSTTGSWVSVPRPVAVLGLGLPHVDGQPLRIEARRDEAGVARLDGVAAGRFAETGPHVAFHLRRQTSGQEPGFVIDLVRLAALDGLAVSRSQRPSALVTKFGPVEAADIALSGEGRERACIAFRHRTEREGATLIGWQCGPEGRAADRQQLACLIDRLTLVGAGEDRDLRAVFSRAELNRLPACTPPKLQAAGRRANWLDPEHAAPPLRRTTPPRG
jgi:hypothetical protein